MQYFCCSFYFLFRSMKRIHVLCYPNSVHAIELAGNSCESELLPTNSNLRTITLIRAINHIGLSCSCGGSISFHITEPSELILPTLLSYPYPAFCLPIGTTRLRAAGAGCSTRDSSAVLLCLRVIQNCKQLTRNY